MNMNSSHTLGTMYTKYNVEANLKFSAKDQTFAVKFETAPNDWHLFDIDIIRYTLV